MPCGVVTNAPRPNAELMLAGLGLAGRFPVLVIGDELASGKPHPLPYLTGLRTPRRDCRHDVRVRGLAVRHPLGGRGGLLHLWNAHRAGDEALRAAGASAVIADFTEAHLLAALDAALAGDMPAKRRRGGREREQW